MGYFPFTQKSKTAIKMAAFIYMTTPNPLDDIRRVLFPASPGLLTLPVCAFSRSQVESSKSFADDVDRRSIGFDDSFVDFRSKVNSNKSVMAGAEGVKIKRRSRLLREVQLSLNSVYWTGWTGPQRSKGSTAARDEFLSRGDFSHKREHAYPRFFF